ncbi:helix-turn-helix domain-containing protein [Nocardia aurea]|uniref:helix-turn-helix domain-containing protein n=1 Tax=Nocardia aurea TaxID=2144174 RepID=UPI000D692B96|nr:helix-turn-helix domain-containing protein [Nocardia aurea]
MTRPTNQPAALPEETKTALRTLGTLALRLADGAGTDLDWYRTHLEGVPRIDGPSTLLTIPEACTRLRLSRWGLYQLINNRELATVKIGRRRFVPLTEVQRFVDELTVVGGRS